MSTIHSSYPLGEEQGEYSLLVYPDESVTTQLHYARTLMLKTGIADRCHRERPAICLAHFLAKEAMEPTLIRWIQNICGLHACFPLALNGVELTSSQGLAVGLSETEAMTRLAQALRILDPFMESNHCPPLYLEPQPSLPLLHKVSLPLLEELRPALTTLDFCERFLVEKLVLVRHDRVSCSQQLINTFTLTNRQGTA